MIQPLMRFVAGLSVLAVVLTGAVDATPAVAATQTCAQLEQTLHRLQNLYAHVSSDEARQDLADKIDATIAQMERQNCFAIVTRSFNGTATTWTDTGKAPGPMNTPISFELRISTTGQVTWSLPRIVLTPDITVTQQQGSTATGQINTSGYLSLTVPIEVSTQWGSGSASLNLSTMNTIATRSGTFSGGSIGNAANRTGPVTVVGSASFSVLFETVNAQSRLVGSLS